MGHAWDLARRRKLTRRQTQVVQLAAFGMADKEVARHLGLSTRTVRDHFTEARRRWEAANRVELIAMAVESGIARHHPDPADANPRSARGQRRSRRDDAGAGTVFGNHEISRQNDLVSATPLDGSSMPAVHATRATRDISRHPGRPTVMTPERVEAARELLPQYTVTEVARKIGIGRTTLHAHLTEITGA